MTSSLYAKDTPLRLKGKRYSKPFPIRWWYGKYHPEKNLHSLEHVFWCNTGSRKWRQDTIYKTTIDITINFVPLPIGGENDK